MPVYTVLTVEDTELLCLSKLSEVKACGRVWTTKQLLDDLPLASNTYKALSNLRRSKLIEFSSLDSSVHITRKGEQTLLQIQEKRSQQAKEERQRRIDNKLSVLQLLVPLVIFIVGVVIEHYSVLAEFLSDFFG